jgi:hypothetical protein
MSPEGPREANEATDGGCVAPPLLQLASALFVCCQPAHVSPDAVSSWFRS